jgi:thymidylate synthase
MNKTNTLDAQYLELLYTIIAKGTVKKDRTGTGTISIFGTEIRHDMRTGFPLLTTKQMFMRGIAVELEWFLQGRTDVKYLVDQNVNIWNGDAYKNFCRLDIEDYKAYAAVNPEKDISWEMTKPEDYLERIKNNSAFADKYGQLGPIYGHQWRNQGGQFIDKNGILHNEGIVGVDQIADVMNLLRNDPDNRRIKVDAWKPNELQYMTLPPCHTDFQFYTRELSLRERIDVYSRRHPTYVMIPEHYHMDQHNIPKRAVSLKWQQRSVDTFLGLPFNIASYALLLELVALEQNMVAETLIGSLGDTHIYSNHIDMCREQLERSGKEYELPTLQLAPEATVDNFRASMMKVENYKYHPKIEAPLSN